jgi:tetraacyldisaccharide 4'-kinase
MPAFAGMTAIFYPFSLIYRAIIATRKFLYQKNIFKTNKFPVPVIVVGNITLGGTGKTPLVIWLANFLKSKGYQPGIVSRGYKAQTKHYPQFVMKSMDARLVGDEPLLMAERTNCPVIIDPNRSRAVQHLLKNFSCNVVISDDGLQHYALHRDIEIIVIDGNRLFGNGLCLPAGPLREPLSRIKQSEFLISSHKPYQNAYRMHYDVKGIVNLNNETKTFILQNYPNHKIHAVAGIGHPEQFFQMLEHILNKAVIKHPFPDHHFFKAKDFAAFAQEMIIMTEKDAVKCKPFSQANYYYVKIDAQIDDKFADVLLARLASCSIL